jgi:hypothetical protein
LAFDDFILVPRPAARIRALKGIFVVMSVRYDENSSIKWYIFYIGFQKNTFAGFCEDFFVAAA